jgi:hypothetical protein
LIGAHSHIDCFFPEFLARSQASLDWFLIGLRDRTALVTQLDSLDNPDYLSRYASTTISLVSSPRAAPAKATSAGLAPGAKSTPPPPPPPAVGERGGGSGPLGGGAGSDSSLGDAALAPPVVQTVVTPVLTDDVDYFPPIKYGSYGATDPSPRRGGK